MMTVFHKLLLELVLLLVAFPAHAQSPAVAYTEKGDLYLASASGETLEKITTRVPIGEFDISRGAHFIIFRPARTEYGGPLYRLDLRSRKLEQIVKLCPKNSACSGNVYGEPALSPDEKQVAFAIHGAAHGDLVEAAGPIATVKLATHEIHTLQSTADVDGEGPAFANEPAWSPDGAQILVNFETGAAVTDTNGKTLRDITDLLSSDGWSHVIGWVGNRCVVYVAGRTAREAMHVPLRLLHLDTGKSEDADEIIPARSQTGVVAFSSDLVARRTDDKRLMIIDLSGAIAPWTIPNEENMTFVRMVPNDGKGKRVPTSCQ